MAAREPDPVRATLVAILQQLNRAESIHEGRSHDQSLTLAELERLLERFWAVERRRVAVPHALGLLARNGLVEAGPEPSGGGRGRLSRYRITADGKAFLVEALRHSDRIA